MTLHTFRQLESDAVFGLVSKRMFYGQGKLDRKSVLRVISGSIFWF